MSIVIPGLTRDEKLDGLLESALEHAHALHPGVVTAAAAYLGDPQSQRFGAVAADAGIYPASVIKVPIMVEAFRQYEDGSLRPGDRVIVSAANQTATSGPAPFVPGYDASLAELVELMITHSDNVATNQLMDVLRRERVTQSMQELGLPTFLLGRKLSGSEPLIEDPEMVGRNRLPVAEIARLLLLIATDSVPGAPEQRDILALCVHDEKLVPGLAPGDRFMHKTGETHEVSHDAGILATAGGRNFIVVLHTQVTPTADESDAAHANPFMTAWMRWLRDRL